MGQPLDFQSIILALHHYWAKNGCLIWQPYYTQVGAGTMNPATILRVLGPEPWKVAYVEPSIRPDDGRYGENPNRMQQHYQYQVILKPDPGNPQELYLASLEEVGIDPLKHDIRFVEDNWESPALGAWGLGWEVWLDGQEITQYTYFQQAGGMALDPVSVEITYGLERIAMALQRARSFRDIQWNERFTYGDINLTAEREHSTYYFELANVRRLRHMYKLYEAEAESALSKGPILPAHDYILKCSHTFNILDTRGAIGVTERQSFFSGMRDLSRRVAEAYLAQRQEMEFPFSNGLASETEKITRGKDKYKGKPVKSDKTASFLMEIGTEELPVNDLQNALSQLNEYIPKMMEEQRLSYKGFQIMGTPRRLVVHIFDVSPIQEDQLSILKGPPVNRAYDSSGEPTPAALGFARSKGVTVDALEKRKIEGGEYVVAIVHEKGRPTVEVFSETLPKLIAALHFDKPMRWNSTNVYFSRPIRWLLALCGEEIIPFEYAGIQSNNKTYLLRNKKPEYVEVKNIDVYFESLSAQGIILDPSIRQDNIATQIETIMREAGGEPLIRKSLLEEVTNLVEAPCVLLGQFNPSHLKLPSEVLVSVMEKHQRYFPVKDSKGKILPNFIVVSNGDHQNREVVVDGNEQVIHARFTDAEFFISEDLKFKLEDYLHRLNTLTFHYELGSMRDKSDRIEKLVKHLLNKLQFDDGESKIALRAAHLCKADLVTNMVIEMTSLQGIMGQYYALKSGESQQVAIAIFEHYLPRFAGDDIPQTKPGLIIGLADRLDTLTGLFAAGMAPSGTKDPFALRRTALGLVQNIISWNIHIDLEDGIVSASQNLPIQLSSEALESCLKFIVSRLRNYLLEQGWRYDIVDAVLAEQKNNPAAVQIAVKELSDWVSQPDWKSILPAYSRCVRITRDEPFLYEIQTDLFTMDDEKDLYQALLSVEKTDKKEESPHDMLSAFIHMIPVINRFFDNILVMDEDTGKRNNRLGLLQRISALTSGVADFSLLEGF